MALQHRSGNLGLKLMLSATLVNRVVAGDHRLMRKVNRWNPPRLLRKAILFSTYAGDGWLWYILGVVILALGGERRWQAFGAAASAAGVAIGVFKLLKHSTARVRPCAIESHCWATLLPPDRFSFPSGHSMTAFAVSIAIGMSYASLLGGLLLCAVSIAASRILLGMHFLSDVLAGSIIGALLGWGAFLLFR